MCNGYNSFIVASLKISSPSEKFVVRQPNCFIYQQVEKVVDAYISSGKYALESFGIAARLSIRRRLSRNLDSFNDLQTISFREYELKLVCTTTDTASHLSVVYRLRFTFRPLQLNYYSSSQVLHRNYPLYNLGEDTCHFATMAMKHLEQPLFPTVQSTLVDVLFTSTFTHCNILASFLVRLYVARQPSIPTLWHAHCRCNINGWCRVGLQTFQKNDYFTVAWASFQDLPPLLLPRAVFHKLTNLTLKHRQRVVTTSLESVYWQTLF